MRRGDETGLLPTATGNVYLPLLIPIYKDGDR